MLPIVKTILIRKKFEPDHRKTCTRSQFWLRHRRSLSGFENWNISPL